MSCETGTDVFACWPAKRGVAVPALAGLVRGAVVTVVFAPPDPAWTVAASGAGSRREEVLI